MRRYPIVVSVLILLVTTLACGVGGPVTRRNNEVRRAALAYELSTRGTAGEVMIAFRLTEVRDNLGFEDGNTVWLNPLAERDYFRKRMEQFRFFQNFDTRDRLELQIDEHHVVIKLLNVVERAHLAAPALPGSCLAAHPPL